MESGLGVFPLGAGIVLSRVGVGWCSDLVWVGARGVGWEFRVFGYDCCGLIWCLVMLVVFVGFAG